MWNMIYIYMCVCVSFFVVVVDVLAIEDAGDSIWLHPGHLLNKANLWKINKQMNNRKKIE